MVSVPEMARHRKNPCLPVVHPTPIKQWNGGAEHPGLLDGLPFRWVSTVAALPVRTPGGEIIQRLGWLLLPPLRRQSDLRQPNQKHARSAHFQACKLRLLRNQSAGIAGHFAIATNQRSRGPLWVNRVGSSARRRSRHVRFAPKATVADQYVIRRFVP